MATFLVTGASRGLGLEFVKQLVGRGENVIATCRGDRSMSELDGLYDTHENLQVMELEVADDKSIATLARQLEGRAIDVLINNAGVYGPRGAAIGQLEGEGWSEVMRVNCIAPILLTQALLPNLREGAGKKLVFITSKMGSIADNRGGGSYAYRSSKSALNSAVKSLAVDLAGEDFVSVVLHPGWVQTDMGGPNALIDAETSVSGMLRVIDRVGQPDSGGFFAYDGAAIPW